MYTDKHLWQMVRKRVLVDGESIRAVATGFRMSRNTVSKILDSPDPPKSKTQKSIVQAQSTVQLPRQTGAKDQLDQWLRWLYRVERHELFGVDDQALLDRLDGATLTNRKKILTVLAATNGFSAGQISKHLLLAKNTTLKYLRTFKSGGVIELLQPKVNPKKSEDPAIRDAIFKLLHEPPSLSGFNRTTWRMADLREALLKQEISVGPLLICVMGCCFMACLERSEQVCRFKQCKEFRAAGCFGPTPFVRTVPKRNRVRV